MENNLNLTIEMLEQAKSAPSAAALLTLAQENGITLTAEQAATCFAQLHPETGALSDEELDSVSGGGCSWNIAPIDVCVCFCSCGKISACEMEKGKSNIYKCSCGRTWNVYSRHK